MAKKPQKPAASAGPDAADLLKPPTASTPKPSKPKPSKPKKPSPLLAPRPMSIDAELYAEELLATWLSGDRLYAMCEILDRLDHVSTVAEITRILSDNKQLYAGGGRNVAPVPLPERVKALAMLARLGMQRMSETASWYSRFEKGHGGR